MKVWKSVSITILFFSSESRSRVSFEFVSSSSFSLLSSNILRIIIHCIVSDKWVGTRLSRTGPVSVRSTKNSTEKLHFCIRKNFYGLFVTRLSFRNLSIFLNIRSLLRAGSSNWDYDVFLLKKKTSSARHSVAPPPPPSVRLISTDWRFPSNHVFCSIITESLIRCILTATIRHEVWYSFLRDVISWRQLRSIVDKSNLDGT